MSSAMPTADPRHGWFADSSLLTKSGVISGVVVLAFGAVALVAASGVGRASEASERVGDLMRATALALQVDARAGELEVDAYGALVREDPTAGRETLAEDVTAAQQQLDELSTITLTGPSARAVSELEAGFVDHADAVTAFVDSAVVDQSGARASWEDVQEADDLLDADVDAAQDALATATDEAEAEQGAAVRAAVVNQRRHRAGGSGGPGRPDRGHAALGPPPRRAGQRLALGDGRR